MICDGCQNECHSLTGLAGADGTMRGRFCITCRDWLTQGHRDAPVVMIHSGRKILGEGRGTRITRTYRNDTTGKFYQLVRNVIKGEPSFFVAYGPAKSRDTLINITTPIVMNGFKVWGADLSWKKAERLFLKLLQKS